MHSNATPLRICAALLVAVIPACASAVTRPVMAAGQQPPGQSAAAAQASPQTATTPPATALLGTQPPQQQAPPPTRPQAPGATQQAPPQAPATPPQQQAAPQQQPATTQKPTYKMSIDMVTTDVIVRDGRGQFVPDISKNEFEVYEDGVKQDIVQMQLVSGGRHTSLVAAPPPAAEEGILLPPSRQANDVAGRILIFFIDDLHLEFRNTARVRKLLEDMAKTLIHDGDMFAIQTTGPSSVAVDLTYDKKRFTDSIKKIAGSELKPSEIINGPESADGPSEVRYRAHVAFSTVNDLLQVLEQVRDRRKALIYVSDGYDFNPFEQSRMGEDPNGIYEGRIGQNRADAEADPWSRQGQQFADADLVRELADLTRTANRANVSMYTFDPRGLVAGGDLDEQVDPTEWNDYLHKSQDSLRVLAEQTGGIAVINQNDFSKALQQIDAETSDYYMLGYYSKNPDPTKRYRAIEVKVTRPIKGMTVKARKGYQLKRLPRSAVPSTTASK